MGTSRLEWVEKGVKNDMCQKADSFMGEEDGYLIIIQKAG